MPKSDVKLDRDRPYGTIYGEETHGGVFSQDGRLFNNDGVCVYEDAAQIKEAERRAGITAESKAKRRAQLEAELAQLNAELGGAAVATEIEAGSELEAQLNQLNAAQVKQLLVEKGVEPESGPGSKARNVAKLLEIDAEERAANEADSE